MKFYTWKDIERFCLKNKKKWEKMLDSIDVYPDEIILYTKEGVKDSQAMDMFGEIFPKNIERKGGFIRLDRDAELIRISFEEGCDIREKAMKPLFEKVIYQESAYPEYNLEQLSCPVLAFHSYKGGVGRTLSLLAFARAWTNIRKNDSQNKLLIIDSDLEAPGLTWIQGEGNDNDFSYLDLLTLIQDMEDLDSVVDVAVKEMGSLSIPIETDRQTIEHIFLPTFRYDEQLFDLYAGPNSVISARNRDYILAEVISKIAVRLGASAVLVDLRAGVSEYSAPLLFDPRVKKFFVTSTSYQSITGTKKLLEYVSRGLDITEHANLPTILLSMVPPTLSEAEKSEIVRGLISCFKVDAGRESLLDNVLVELAFASELIHLKELRQILDSLKNRDMYLAIEQIVQQYFGVSDESGNGHAGEQREVTLKKIREFADKQITAEANGTAELLLTKPIKNMCSRYHGQIPTVVVRGAKGSGKTFLYRQLLEQTDWYSFCDNINEKNSEIKGGYMLPVFAPKNIVQIKHLLQRCLETFHEKISFAETSKSIYIDNANELLKQIEQETDWLQFWEKLFAGSVNKDYGSFDLLSETLHEQNEKIVFLVDGLEEILRDVSSNAIQQKAVQVLCQDIVNVLAARYDNIGIIIFLRNDMAQNAITVNYEQFKQSHSYAELKWSQEEALKLAVWLVGQAAEGFYETAVSVENASKDVIDRHLEKLWGLKLGKNNSNEAFSSKWILAALSDFNGQLQARDMIRFLKYAAQPGRKKAAYDDRILMPGEIRVAVSICSNEKIEEIKTEYVALEPIFEKLKNLEEDRKILPLNLGDDALTPMEEKLMIQEGYLTRDGEKLYLPEIIRHALGFRYERGARPRVLSLLLKR